MPILILRSTLPRAPSTSFSTPYARVAPAITVPGSTKIKKKQSLKFVNTEIVLKPYYIAVISCMGLKNPPINRPSLGTR